MMLLLMNGSMKDQVTTWIDMMQDGSAINKRYAPPEKKKKRKRENRQQQREDALFGEWKPVI
jgi:hypothetical protein